MDDPHTDDESPSTQLAGTQVGSRAWLLGAYTFLLLWGATFLVLYFTDRLPI